MYKVRILFIKDGPAKYISHLDLMQVFRRAFSRINLRLSYSGGFHPHMQMNILLPLSTGFSSQCELLDFELETDREPDNLIMRLNTALPEGVCAVRTVDSSRRAGDIAFASYRIIIEDGPDAESAASLFARDEIMMLKRTKRGENMVNIKPMIRSLEASDSAGGTVINAALAAGQESLNPEYIVRAIERYLGFSELYASYRRLEILDADGAVFR